jgi:hypothetical protein
MSEGYMRMPEENNANIEVCYGPVNLETTVDPLNNTANKEAALTQL